MTDDQIQELILAFLATRGGYVAGASERELFLMVKAACAAERERCAQVAENRARNLAKQRIGVPHDPSDEVALRLYAAVIRAFD